MPGIYYILPDSYPSSRFQQEVLGANKNELDSQLISKGFYVVSDPSSNYNNTAFSMADMFQMDYLEWLKELYPGMSNVNTFRIIFNKYFGQQLPLLKDSTIYLE